MNFVDSSQDPANMVSRYCQKLMPEEHHSNLLLCPAPAVVHKPYQSRIVKNSILDTNVLLHDPNSLLNFADNHVLVPIEVIEEIDRFKQRESTELGPTPGVVSPDAGRVPG